MFTSNEIEALSMSFDSRMRQLEQDVMSDIIRRISINGEITRSADWQINRLYELGVAKDDIKKTIQKALNLKDEEVEEMFRKAIESGYARNEDIYKKLGKDIVPFSENKVLQQYISSVAKQTAEEMRNLSQSLGFAVKNPDGTISFTPIAEYYQNTLDNAINGIANGVFDYNTAIKRAVNELTKSGLRSVDYASGWSNRVDVAARRAVMTGMGQLTGKVNEMNAEELGTDMYEVSWHGGARPSHQVWQGRWYTMEQLKSVCGLGTVTGLNGADCYHDYYPVIPGISEPTYTEEELEEMNRRENTPVRYGDKEYTKYEALQRQRKLETAMRAQRQKIKLLEQGKADEDDIIAARGRYRVTSQEYSRFSKAMDLPQQRERVTVDGLGNIGQGRWKVDKMQKNDIIAKKTNTEVSTLQEIGKIDIEKYQIITDKKIITDDVVLTDNRIEHIIERRGQEFYDEYRPFFGDILSDPDFIFKDSRENTALVSKRFFNNGTTVNIVLKLVVEGDNPNYKNSIITAIKESNKRFEQRLRNNTPLYKKS